MILPGEPFCKLRYKLHAEQCSFTLPAGEAVFHLIVWSEGYIISNLRSVLNPLHYI